MSVDANGRTHRPKGLPKGVAGTFGTSAAARGDADLDESPYRLGGDGSRAEAMRLADEWFGAGDDRPPTGGSPVHTVVNRNTGGLLLVSDKGRVVDVLPLGVDDDGVHIRFRDYGRVNPGRLSDVRRGMFDETWADRRPSRRRGDEWEATVRMDPDAYFGPEWDTTPIHGAVALASLDDPTVPSPDFAGRDADPAETIRDGDMWMLDEHGQPEPAGNGVDPFDPRETDRMRRDFIEDRMDAQTEALGPLPRHVESSYREYYGGMFDRALRERRERVEYDVGGSLRSPDMTGEPGQAELARAAARSRSIELRDAALDSGLLDMSDVRRLADDPEPLVAAHARRILRRDASPVA